MDAIAGAGWLTLAGCLVILIGRYMFIRGRKLSATGIRTEGVIIDLRRNSDGRSPVVKFNTLNGDEIIRESNYSAGDERIGSKVKIIYDPDNPGSFTINGMGGETMGPIAILLGALMIVGALIVLMLHFFKKH
jgi:hypothetical protein